MAWSISDWFPSWGDSGEQPSSGFNYQGQDLVNEKHFDYLWNALYNLEDEMRAALSDIDSDADGVVDEADSANTYKGNDIDTDGDGVVNEADNSPLFKQTDIDTDYSNTEASGLVSSGDAGLMYVTEVADGDTFEVYHASFTEEATAAPSGTGLVVATLDGSGGGTHRTTVLSGDGTMKAGETGTPLASWANTTGSAQTVGLLLDNGNFLTGSGSDLVLHGSATARVV